MNPLMYGFSRAARGSRALFAQPCFSRQSLILQRPALERKPLVSVAFRSIQDSWQLSSSAHARGGWLLFSFVALLSITRFASCETAHCAPKNPPQTPVATRTRTHETAEPLQVTPIRCLNNPQFQSPIQVKASAAKHAKLNSAGAANAYADVLWLGNPANFKEYKAHVKTKHPELAQVISPAPLVAKHYGVSERAIRDLVRKGNSTGSTVPKKRPGRTNHMKKSPEKKTLRAMNVVYNEANGQIGVRAVSNRLKGKTPSWKTTYSSKNVDGGRAKRTRTTPSKSTVNNAIKNKLLAFVSMREMPELTDDAIAERKAFVAKYKDESIETGELYTWCAVDESYARHLPFKNARIAFIPAHPDEDGNYYQSHLDIEKKTYLDAKAGIYVEHGGHDHEAMIFLFGVTACPELLNPTTCKTEGAEFDLHRNGLVALFQVRGVAIRKRNDQWGNKGDPMYCRANMDGLLYRYVYECEGGVLDCMEAYEDGKPVEDRIRVINVPVIKKGNVVSTDVETVLQELQARAKKEGVIIDTFKRIQEDGAPGHGYNNRQSGKPTQVHNDLVSNLNEFGLELIKQPKLSPATNPLDIGVWNMLKSKLDVRMSEVPMQKGGNQNEIQAAMWTIIKQEAALLPARNFFNVWQQRQANLKAINKADGGHIGQMPHTGIRKKYGTWEARMGAEEGSN